MKDEEQEEADRQRARQSDRIISLLDQSVEDSDESVHVINTIAEVVNSVRATKSEPKSDN